MGTDGPCVDRRSQGHCPQFTLSPVASWVTSHSSDRAGSGHEMGHWASPQTQSRLLEARLRALRRHRQGLAVFVPACWVLLWEALVKAWPAEVEAMDWRDV